MRKALGRRGGVAEENAVEKVIRFAHTDQSSIRSPGMRPKWWRLRVSKTTLFAKAMAAIFRSCVPTFSRNVRRC
jgi:hypothetical protein